MTETSLREKYTRTVCACAMCKACCDTCPGMLIPGDLQLIVDHILGTRADEDEVMDFITAHFEASEGARVKNSRTGAEWHVPTIVPRARRDGSCVFLDEKRLCKIHEVSPFGCSYVDAHMKKEPGDRRVNDALSLIQKNMTENGTYWQIWQMLQQAGKVAEPVRVRNRKKAGAVRAAERRIKDRALRQKAQKRRKKENRNKRRSKR